MNTIQKIMNILMKPNATLTGIISIPCTRNEILPIKLISRSMLHDTNGSIKQ